MRKNYNYRESLNNIKAGLFDIYEEQEKLINLETDIDEKKSKSNDYEKLKAIAVTLIEKIEKLHEEENSLDIDNNQDQVAVESDYADEEESEISIENNVEEKNENLKKYYLNCSLDKVNYAYVPESIYKIIKKNSSLLNDEKNEEDFFEEEMDEDDTTSIDDVDTDNNVGEEEKDLNIYKDDDEKPRGIIVRNDQYMKLALSKHRQKSVLEEAKEFRKKEVLKKQREEQKRELEKAELKFDI